MKKRFENKCKQHVGCDKKIVWVSPEELDIYTIVGLRAVMNMKASALVEELRSTNKLISVLTREIERRRDGG